MLKIMAVNRLETEKPLIKWWAINTMIPFITIRKSPKVKIVTGKVRMIRIGLTIVLRRARTTATTNAVYTDETTIPGRIYPTTIIEMVLIMMRVSRFMLIRINN
jgi:hypothetical protein